MIAGALSTPEPSVVTAALVDAVSSGQLSLPNLPKGASLKDIPQSVIVEAAKNLPPQELKKAMGNIKQILKQTKQLP